MASEIQAALPYLAPFAFEPPAERRHRDIRPERHGLGIEGSGVAVLEAVNAQQLAASDQLPDGDGVRPFGWVESHARRLELHSCRSIRCIW